MAKEVVPAPRFVIESEIPGVGSFSPEQLQAVSQKSCSVLQSLVPQIQWLQSFVTDYKIYCVYSAPNEETVRQHASLGGFPADVVAQVRSVIDPTTAEAWHIPLTGWRLLTADSREAAPCFGVLSILTLGL